MVRSPTVYPVCLARLRSVELRRVRLARRVSRRSTLEISQASCGKRKGLQSILFILFPICPEG